MSDPNDNIPLVLNASLRDLMATQFVAADFAKRGMPSFANDVKELEKTILWAYYVADKMMLAREGKLPWPK